MSNGNPTPSIQRDYMVDDQEYKDMYQASVTDPSQFWAEKSEVARLAAIPNEN